MSEIKMMHCKDGRTQLQHVYVETADGKFKYEVFMDYAKDLPEDLDMIPYNGNIAGGFCDVDDNLYCVLRGGSGASPFSPGPKTCIVMLDPEGHYVKKIGEGKLGPVHFGNMTPEGKSFMITTTNQQEVLEMDMDGNILARVGGRYNGNKPHNLELDPHYIRMHYGLYGTEPMFYGGGHGNPYDQMLDFINTQYCEEPFNCPNGVDFDSKGNMYVCDGYGNYAIHKFDRQGNHIKTWGGKGVFDYKTDTPGKFLVPHTLCVDANDHIWVCDREKDAIHVFDTEGNVIAYCSHEMAQPSGVDTDGTYVYVVGRGGYLTIFDLEFNIVGQLGFFNGNLRGHDLAADSKGNLYLFPTHANEEHQVIALKRVK